MSRRRVSSLKMRNLDVFGPGYVQITGAHSVSLIVAVALCLLLFPPPPPRSLLPLTYSPVAGELTLQFSPLPFTPCASCTPVLTESPRFYGALLLSVVANPFLFFDQVYPLAFFTDLCFLGTVLFPQIHASSRPISHPNPDFPFPP